MVGYVADEPVIEQSLDADGVPARLELSADDAELQADSADMTRIILRIVDKYGNVLPYSSAVVTLDAEGPADIVGDTLFPLIGGQAAVYLRARRDVGEVVVRATTPRLPPVQVHVQLK